MSHALYSQNTIHKMSVSSMEFNYLNYLYSASSASKFQLPTSTTTSALMFGEFFVALSWRITPFFLINNFELMLHIILLYGCKFAGAVESIIVFLYF